MEEHPLVALVVVLLGDLLAPVGVALPQLHVADLLDLQDPGVQKQINVYLIDRF